MSNSWKYCSKSFFWFLEIPEPGRSILYHRIRISKMNERILHYETAASSPIHLRMTHVLVQYFSRSSVQWMKCFFSRWKRIQGQWLLKTDPIQSQYNLIQIRIPPSSPLKLPDFSSPEALNLPYNQPISTIEVQSTIASCSKKSSPVSDQITATMLQHLHSNSLQFLTSLVNTSPSPNSQTNGKK